MNWEAIQAVAELTAAAGVLFSLGYLAVQIRHNTASVQAGTVSRASETLNRLRTTIWASQEGGQIYQLALSGEKVPDPTLEARVRLFWVALAKDYEAVFYQYQAGQLPQTIWEGWLTEITMILDTPGGRDALVGMKGTILSDSFVKFIQTQLRSPDTPRLLDVRAAWSAAAEARREQSER